MGFLSVFRVRGSGLENKTEVDVLEALAFFMNEKTGKCFPSTEAIARVARVQPNLVRKTLKELEAKGLISVRQSVGRIRYFDLHFDLLPENDSLQIDVWEWDEDSEPFAEVTLLHKPKGVANSQGVAKSTPLAETKVLSKSTKTPCDFGVNPLRNRRDPLAISTAEQGKNKEITRKEQGMVVADENPGSKNLFGDDEPKLEKSKTATRLSIKSLPNDWRAYAEEKEPEVDPDLLFEDFYEYWTNPDTKDAKKKDWGMTWRRRVRDLRNAEDWKRRPFLKNKPAEKPTTNNRYYRPFREKTQAERVYDPDDLV